MHAQVSVQQIVNLGAVLQEESMADAPVTDTVTDDQMLRAVDGHPAVV